MQEHKITYAVEHWMRKICRLAGKVFYNSRYKGGTTVMWVRGQRGRTVTPRWVTHRWENDNTKEVLALL